jgi:hypothetical protein
MNVLDAVREAVAAFNGGDRSALGAALGRSFFTHLPPRGEPGANEVIGSLIGDLAVGFPDLVIGLADLEPDGDGAHGRATLRGTYAGPLWGVEPTGHRLEWTVAFRVRPVDDGLAFNLEDLGVPVIMDLLRQIEQVNPADRMHLPPPHATSLLPELLLRLAFNGQVADKPCGHLGEVRVIGSDLTRCSRCGPDDVWPALRLCLTCGHVGCCDTSINKHARGHFEATGHPLMRSLRAGETWGWCYVDGVLVGGTTLARSVRDRGA